MRLINLSAATFAIALFGCGSSFSVDPTSNSNNESAVGSTPIAADTKLDWPYVRDSVLPACLQCHAGIQAPSLDTYAKVTGRIEDVQAEIGDDSMPPPEQGYAPLSACQKASLNKWIENGTPEASDFLVTALPECAAANAPAPDPAPTPPPQTPALNYDTLVKNILQPYCIRCHNPKASGDARLILFYPFSEITKGAGRWKAPGATSKIVKVISRKTSGRMPPQSEGDGLTAEEIDFVTRWIDAGKPQ